MHSIATSIARSIREQKWLYIEYYNTKELKITYFWICILDIDADKRKFKVQLFNQEYSYEAIDGNIYFDNIKKAEIIEGTYYKVPEALTIKLQQQHHKFSFIEYASVNDRILQYYIKCYQQDRDAAVKNYSLVKGLDVDILSGKTLSLTEQQYQEFVVNLQLYHKKKKDKYQQKIIKMAINVVSIKTSNGLYPIVYRDILLDIERKEILAHEENCYNMKLQSNDENKKSNFLLSYYYDGELQDFIKDFQQNRERCLKQVCDNLRRNECLDENPYMFKLEQYIPVNIEREYQEISLAYKEQRLSAPLKSFFASNEKERKRKPKSIIVHEDNANIDQLRSEFNALIRNVVYVQGPPGTGKTRTIINIILSCLLNSLSALIVSNNNEAINNIYRKITTYTWKQHTFTLPVLRLGSNEKIKITLRELHEQLTDDFFMQDHTMIQSRVKDLKSILIEKSKHLETSLDEYENQSELIEQMDSLKQIIKDITEESSIDEVSKSLAITGVRAQLQQLGDHREKNQEFNYAYPHMDEEILMEYLYLSSIQHMLKLKTTKYKDLYAILLIIDENDRYQTFKKFIEDEASLKLLLDIFPFIISTNISCTKLASPTPLFDLMIMDEASQCNNAHALIPMARCKRAIFVGDQNQLQPVITLSASTNAILMKSFDIPEAYSYKENSILSTLLKVDTLSKFILLREHFRCHEKIIRFANKKYYDNELKLCSKLHNVDALKLIDIKSMPTNEKNTSPTEVNILLQEIKKNEYKNIAIITPFRKQAELIERELLRHKIEHIKVGTIHTFQGDEKDRIILCSGIAGNAQPGSFNWMKNNQQLLNVATTRAKENLTLICDVQKIRELSGSDPNDFSELVDYMKSDGNYEVAYRENEIFTNKVKNFKYYNMKTEEQLLKTLLHIKSVYGQISVKNKVPVKSVLSVSTQELSLFPNGEHSVFDFVVYDLKKHPLVALEVASADHLSKEKTKVRSEKKQALCNKYHFKLMTIGNDYVRRYSFIKQAILDAITV